MAESIVKIPSTADQDFDFLAFSFNGKHSWDDFGLYRVSDGDRYNTELSPQMNDITAENPSADGMYFFNSFHKQKVFNINFAFEEISDATLRSLKQWLNGKEQGDLWFEEEPYKVYTAKVTGTPTLKFIPFDKYVGDTKTRVYRGEGSIQFTAYWPYAHTPDFVETKTNMNTSGYNPTNNGKLWSNYEDFQNYEQWGVSSGLAIESEGSLTNAFTTTCTGENPGDLPAPFVLKASSISGMTDQSHLTFKVGTMEITIPAATVETSDGTNVYTHYRDIKWDSKTGIVSGRKTTDASEKEKPIPYTGTSLGAIPVGENSGFVWGLKQNTTPVSYSTTNLALEYDYWYY